MDFDNNGYRETIFCRHRLWGKLNQSRTMSATSQFAKKIPLKIPHDPFAILCPNDLFILGQESEPSSDEEKN